MDAVSEGIEDNYAHELDLLDREEPLCTCPLHHPDDELGIETDDSNEDRGDDLVPDDGGIEIQGK